MEIIDYFQSDRQAHWRSQIASCEWRAAGYLAQLLEENKLRETFQCEALYLLMDGEHLVSFLTLAQKDCVDASYGPWAGFVYTAPEYRGRRLAGLLMEHAAQAARRQGAQRLYVNTDHVGLYEKYGYIYIKDIVNYGGDTDCLYAKELR